MILAVISHTEHFISSSGQLVGWGATVREMNNLVNVFDKVIHIAPLHPGVAPAGMLPYDSNRIEFVALRPAGGNSIRKKLGILSTFRHNLNIIKQQLRRCDIFQFRAPTGLGVLLIPYLLCSNRPGWFKYAGNWVQQKPPIGYALQRFYLNHQNKRIVTINGAWPRQKNNQLTFENPCLTNEEREAGLIAIKNKDYSGKLNFVFIGRLEDEKGVQRILNAFVDISSNRIGKIHFVGDGSSRLRYEKFVMSNDIANVVFHGYLTRGEINSLLEQSHVFMLPSYASEGFPKVIAEAANYGLIPIVSDVSSIGQYIIDGATGFIVPNADQEVLRSKLINILTLKEDEFKRIAQCAYKMAESFTYEHYNNRILNEIANK